MRLLKVFLYIPAVLTVLMIVLVYNGVKPSFDLGSYFKSETHKEEVDTCPHELHYSYFSTKDFFDKAYKASFKIEKPNGSIKGIFVNHHLLAPHLIASTMNAIATEEKVTVVLISPNHFSSGNGQIISTINRWDTPYGVLDSDCSNISELGLQGVIKIDTFPFKKEHGISGIVPFIKKSLPNSKIIPIIVKDTISEKDIITFVESLYSTLGEKVIVVGSFDFSHYLPDKVAEFHDTQSISVIKNFDYEGTQRMETDSVPGVEIVMRYMEKSGAQHFTVTANTNSAKILNDPSIEETTSYINGLFSKGERVNESSATIISFGDMMLDRFVRKKIEENSPAYPFENLGRFLRGGDIVVANLEGSFTNFPSKTIHNYNGPLVFTFDPQILPELKRLGFTLFSKANNHTLNFGREGINESKKLIEQVDLDWFGDPSNKDIHSYTTTVRGQKITFVGYHQFANQGLDTVLDDIRIAKENGSFVIVYPHWGEEYKKFVTKTQTDTAHSFIDAGADLILGSHPHVIEPIEVYKGKAIFYSLGNFIFDQANRGPTSEGLSVGITISEHEVTYYLFPLTIRMAQASLMSYKERGILLADIAHRSEVEDDIKNQIKIGKIRLKK
jgi:poly-gamma-glutamate synthesis protein (capsule biosynthesis protein)